MYISVTNVSHGDRYNISMAVISWKLGVSTSGVYGPGTVSEFTVGQYLASPLNRPGCSSLLTWKSDVGRTPHRKNSSIDDYYQEE